MFQNTFLGNLVIGASIKHVTISDYPTCPVIRTGRCPYTQSDYFKPAAIWNALIIYYKVKCHLNFTQS